MYFVMFIAIVELAAVFAVTATAVNTAARWESTADITWVFVLTIGGGFPFFLQNLKLQYSQACL